LEGGIGISIGAFGIEVLAVVVAAIPFFAAKAENRSAGAFNALLAITVISGAISLWFPLAVLLESPRSVASWSPIFISILIGAPLMPLAVWILGRRQRRT
jgi:hypothetical protein